MLQRILIPVSEVQASPVSTNIWIVLVIKIIFNYLQ